MYTLFCRMTVLSRDVHQYQLRRFGNKVTTAEGQPSFWVDVEGPGAAATEVVESGVGEAVVYYQCAFAGDYQLEVRLAGSDALIGGRPVSIRVEPDIVAVASCQVAASTAAAVAPHDTCSTLKLSPRSLQG